MRSVLKRGVTDRAIVRLFLAGECPHDIALHLSPAAERNFLLVIPAQNEVENRIRRVMRSKTATRKAWR